jgi:hypothetical protein
VLGGAPSRITREERPMLGGAPLGKRQKQLPPDAEAEEIGCASEILSPRAYLRDSISESISPRIYLRDHARPGQVRCVRP